MHRIHVSRTVELQEDGTFKTIAEQFYDVPFVPIKADRQAQSQSGNLLKTTQGQTGQSQANASQERGTLLPMLQREATGNMGLSPTQMGQFRTSAMEAAGGANAGLTGEANLATARTRNAGGFGSALDEAARQRQKQIGTAAQQANQLSTQVALDRQRQAQQQLQGLYGTDTSAALQSMGLSSQAIQDELAAGRQGWLQNVESGLQTAGSIGSGFGGAATGIANLRNS